MRYDLSKATVDEVLADPEVVAVVERFRPGLSKSRDAKSVEHLTVDQALEVAKRYARPGELERARAALEAL